MSDKGMILVYFKVVNCSISFNFSILCNTKPKKLISTNKGVLNIWHRTFDDSNNSKFV